jgi:probable HAF family extracellular repeat protein
MDRSGQTHSFLLSGRTYTTLDGPPLSFNLPVSAGGINALGEIVGSYTDARTGLTHGFLRSTNGVYTTLDVPGNVYGTRANAINNFHQIVGNNFLLSDGTYTHIFKPGSAYTEAYGINDSGQIVGYYSDGTREHGFLLDNGIYTTIDPPGSLRTEALGINDLGQIVGTYMDAGGNYHGFLATPTPEPSTLLLLAIGTLGVIGWARLRLINRGGLYRGSRAS